MIVAILGVETNYGHTPTRYRVLDALTTLAFYYPPRAEFFKSELAQLFLLKGANFPYDIDDLMGSYAGAMGWGQFMPSSIAQFARDGDGDGKIDLWNSLPDICQSVANYFVAHGWEKDGPIALPRDGRARTRARSNRPDSRRCIRCSNCRNGVTRRRKNSIRCGRRRCSKSKVRTVRNTGSCSRISM